MNTGRRSGTTTTSSGHHNAFSSPSNKLQSLPHLPSHLPSSNQFFLGCHSLSPNLQHFISDIHSNKFTMASDGSVRAPNGSFAWVIYWIASKIHWSGHNTIAKIHSDLSSFRTEACDYLGALYALWAILTAFPLPRNSPPIYTTIHIDNSGVVNRSSNTPFSIQQCLLPDWDIFNEALQVCLTIPGTIKVQHIKSHQDSDTNTPKTLPLPARLNILADA